MTLAEATHRLFHQTEEMAEVRGRLSEILTQVEDTPDGTLVAFAIKEIDIVRIMLLYEYELLDTAHIILEEYLSAYYARRIEIERMTVLQIQGRKRELTELRGHIVHENGRKILETAAEILAKTDHLLGQVIDELEQHVINDKDGNIVH
jgi:hypothetical protein